MRIKFKGNFKISIFVLSFVSILVGTSLSDINHFVGTSDIMLRRENSGLTKILDHQLAFDVSLQVIQAETNSISNFAYETNKVYRLSSKHLIDGYIIEMPKTKDLNLNQVLRKTLYLYRSDFTSIRRNALGEKQVSDIYYLTETGAITRRADEIHYTHMYISGSDNDWLIIANYTPGNRKKANQLMETFEITGPALTLR